MAGLLGKILGKEEQRIVQLEFKLVPKEGCAEHAQFLSCNSQIGYHKSPHVPWAETVETERTGVTLIVLLLLRGNIGAQEEGFPVSTYMYCELFAVILPALSTAPDPNQALHCECWKRMTGRGQLHGRELWACVDAGAACSLLCAVLLRKWMPWG